MNIQENREKTRKQVGWIELKDADNSTYQNLGFMCGLEVHQQIYTEKKLFCRCKAGLYHDFNDYDAEIVRHMRPTLSELGEYDGTALMEFKTRKKIIYRIKNDTACTYEIDDTPPFVINREALRNAMTIALQLKTKIVGELHITRKQYLDGSIPTGFQRTAIIGIEGEIPISNKMIRIIQFSIEEDSCREVSDHRHTRVYYADRLGMPLCEVVTYPDMLTPWEAAEAGYRIRYLTRSTNKVRKGIGAARQDVNVSITGGTRIEIKGVAHISWIPKLTHNEAFRQKALLEIRKEIRKRCGEGKDWKLQYKELPADDWKHIPMLKKASTECWKLIAINLPDFGGLLSFFTQPGQSFATEIANRLKVIACLEEPNIYHSEELEPTLGEQDIKNLKAFLKSGERDAQILLWTPDEDLKTAIETIEERCKMAFIGIPNETRKSLPNGTTIFERVLPGADRMYPDTDSAPIPIDDMMIEEARKDLPVELSIRMDQLAQWQVPIDAYAYILRNNLMPILEAASSELAIAPKELALCYAHRLKSYQADRPLPFAYDRIIDLYRYIKKNKLERQILKPMLKTLYHNPNMQFSSILATVGYKPCKAEDILEQIPLLHAMFGKLKHRCVDQRKAEINWIMGRLKGVALGNLEPAELRKRIEAVVDAEVANA
ncbi:MAG: Glu-tRNA(Gln) amidotransferase GatDE subunit E [Candidatus Cloacimonetes bacterium HGW-Cloacimonetes-2]|jgi:glutamyl-tRNA(Gln) amidotransferase subunit E|nr:MAG: Glu-tRNA(Gln) amidotransferase GatDE subunit E [Candidatus Cloacimonetes bacterium HGW-Cloacimonetes-2]